MRNIEYKESKFKIYFDKVNNRYIERIYSWQKKDSFEETDNFIFEDDLKYTSYGYHGAAIFESFLDKRLFTMSAIDFSKLMKSKYPKIMIDQLYFSGRFTFCKKGKNIFLKAVDI